MIIIFIISFVFKQYNYIDNNFILISDQHSIENYNIDNNSLDFSEFLPENYYILDYCITDINQDATEDIVLLIKRIWRDWYFMKWQSVETPLINNKDSENFSSSIIILNYYESTSKYKIIWAGSAFISPLLKIISFDIDKDSLQEIITIDGIFENNFNLPGEYLSIWGWNGFGFSLQQRSDKGNYYDLRVSGDSTIYVLTDSL